MNNTQVATLVQTLLMIGGGLLAGTGKFDPMAAQTIVGGISALLGGFWNHYAALQVPKPSAQ